MSDVNYEVVKSIYGEEFTQLLRHLDITTTIDPNEKIRVNHRYTNAGSIWFFGNGDFSFEDKKYGTIHIQGGCLVSAELFEGCLPNRKSFGNIPFGEEYYEQTTGIPMMTEEDYLDYVNAFNDPGFKIGDAIVINKKELEGIIIRELKIEDELQAYTNDNKWVPLYRYVIYTIIADNGKTYYYKGKKGDFSESL